MPLLTVNLAATPSAELTERLAAELTQLTALVLKKNPALTAVVVNYLAPKQWFIGGAAVQAPSFSLDVKVTEGTNTKSEKAAYIAQVFAAFGALLASQGTLAPVNYVVIHELRADTWGFDGKTQERRFIEA